jgi:thioredoxin reductase
LEQENVRVLTGTRVLEIASDSVIVEASGTRSSIPATHVVLAVGARSHAPLSDQLKAEAIPLFVVGDARRPRGIAEAVFEGWRAAGHAAICSLHKRTGEEERCNESYE